MPLVVVSGPLANKPLNGGAAWTRLSWTLGFRQLGWKVFFLEHIVASTCVDAAGAPATFEASANLAFFRDVTHTAGLSGSAALMTDDGGRIWGAPPGQLIELARSADVLIDISGHLSSQPLFKRFRRTVYVDLDPGFTQIWHANGDCALPEHDVFFTVGQNIGNADCSIPTCGITWHPIRQPVVLEDWPVRNHGTPERFTTVASWRGPFGPLEHQGATLGLKVHEFRKFIALPELAHGQFELALDIHPADEKDRMLLQEHGWHVVDPRAVASTPHRFREYVQTSAAEFSVASGVYVHTNSGWVSDRTVRYLASGKPALVQDTGFARRYPNRMGLVPFSTVDEAVDGAERIMRQYAQHSRAARELAETYFAAPTVLGQVLHKVAALA